MIARTRESLGGRELGVVLVRGYLGNYMRGNFVAARDALRAAGVDARIAKNRAGAIVAENAARIARDLPPGELVWCGHSKGGLEALSALADPRLAARTRAVLLSQTPRGGSAVLESLLLGQHRDSLPRRRRLAEATQRLGLRLLNARAGGLQLTSAQLTNVLADVDRIARPFAMWQTASWSSRPTVWLDSFHERLGEVRPGAAHDGQFYLEDLIWAGVPHVLLPHLDHAQPVMDGFGFDSARYWLALVVMASA